LEGHSGSLRSAAFSPDGQRIVTASDDNTARIWDAATGNEIAPLEGHSGSLRSAEFSPDGQRIVTASYDNTARIWDAATGKQIAPLEGHTDIVLSAAFSPDGQRIVTAFSDNTARIWDAATGKQIAPLEGHTGSVESAAFSPDGQRIVTASYDNTARIWDVSRSATVARSLAVALTAALAQGIGQCTDRERTDLLMQDAPEDLYAEARRQLLDPEKYSPEEIARRERLLEQTIAELRAPLHPNCYLSPSQFAEKFGLAASLASTDETGSDPSPPGGDMEHRRIREGSDPASGDMEHRRKCEGSDLIEREGSDPGPAAAAREVGQAPVASRSDGARLATALVLLAAAGAVAGGLAVVALAGRALFGWTLW
jgi:hypothetical protein